MANGKSVFKKVCEGGEDSANTALPITGKQISNGLPFIGFTE
jgi:hypothetical protein